MLALPLLVGQGVTVWWRSRDHHVGYRRTVSVRTTIILLALAIVLGIATCSPKPRAEAEQGLAP